MLQYDDFFLIESPEYCFNEYNSGMIFVLVGPGGAGKTTLAGEIVKRDSNIKLSQSWTTRQRRPQESPDAYKFVSDAEFDKCFKSGGFVETDEICGNRYGTPKENVLQSENSLLILTADGAANLSSQEDAVKVFFVDCPSILEQKRRLRERGDTYKNILKRIMEGFSERKKASSNKWLTIVNKDIVRSTETIHRIMNNAIDAQKVKQ